MVANPKTLPQGYFEKLLAMDCETSGLNFNSVNPAEGYQAISWGLVVADAQTLTPIEKLYVEVKWDGVSKWDDRAEKVHGLSREYLDQTGVSREEAAILIGNLIYKHWPPQSEFSMEKNIRCLGHNVATFDIWFMRNLLEPLGIMFKTGNRFIDTSSIGFGALGTFTSNELFEMVGLPVRDDKKHNALVDAEYALEATRRIRLLCNTIIGE